MKRRDLGWKVAGLVLTLASCGMGLALEHASLAIIFFPFALLGLPLMIHGKRVRQVLRAERRGHGHTVAAVHAVRARRGARQDRNLTG